MIPSGRLVALFALPLALAALVPWLPGAWVPQLAANFSLLLIAAADALLSGARVGARREARAMEVVGRPFTARLLVTSRARRALRVRVTDGWPGRAEGLPAALRLKPGEEQAVSFRILVPRRGIYPLGPIELRVASPLGLWWRMVRIPAPGRLQVTPRFVQVRRGSFAAPQDAQRLPVRARRRAGGENEFERLRPYVAGDPLRHVDWRATARRGSLVSREHQQEVNQSVILLLDVGRGMVGGGAKLSRLDEAIDAALQLAQAALSRGDRVGLLAFDHEVRRYIPPRGGRDQGARLVMSTVDLEASEVESDFSEAYRYLQTRLRRRSLVVLVTALLDEEQLAAATQMTRALSAKHLPLVVWLRDAGVEALMASDSPWERAAAAELFEPRERAMRGLLRRGVLVADVTADRLSAELLASYLEVKSRRLL